MTRRFGLLVGAVLALAAGLTAPAEAATIYGPFGEKQKIWLIVCDSGPAITFGGSPEGANDFATIFCPGGARVTPGATHGDQAAPLVDAKALAEAAGTTIPKVLAGKSGIKPGLASYPPKGYPCLGCEPCPPPEGSFCDTTRKQVVVSPMFWQTSERR